MKKKKVLMGLILVGILSSCARNEDYSRIVETPSTNLNESQTSQPFAIPRLSFQEQENIILDEDETREDWFPPTEEDKKLLANMTEADWQEFQIFYNFNWFLYENKPFLANNAPPGGFVSVRFADVDLDGTNEIILTASYSPKAYIASEIFSVKEKTIFSAGGYMGEPYGEQENTFSLYKNEEGEYILFSISETHTSFYRTTVLVENNIQSQWRPLLAYDEYNEDGTWKLSYIDGYYKFTDDAQGLGRITLEGTGTGLCDEEVDAVRKPITNDEYADLFENHFNEVILVGNVELTGFENLKYQVFYCGYSLEEVFEKGNEDVLYKCNTVLAWQIYKAYKESETV